MSYTLLCIRTISLTLANIVYSITSKQINVYWKKKLEPIFFVHDIEENKSYKTGDHNSIY